MLDYVRHPTSHAKNGSRWKRGWGGPGGGMGEVVTSRAFFFLYFLLVS